MLRARLSPGPLLGLVLTMAMTACGGSGAATEPLEPIETDDFPIVTPAPTVADAATAPPDGNAGSTDDGSGWPATVNVTISGQDFYASGGSYSATGLARICGNNYASMDPTLPLFGFSFPRDGDLNPRDVGFGADDLRPGTTTSVFHVGVLVVNAEGHEPPTVEAAPGEDNSNDTGTASLTEADGKRSLVVDATNDFGTTIKMTVVCGPAPG